MKNVDKQIAEFYIQRDGKLKEIYVIYDIEENLNDIIYQGHAKFLNNYGDGDIYSDVIINPTYLQLATFVNDQIHASKDFHHVFLEKVGMYKEHEIDGLKIISYKLGS